MEKKQSEILITGASGFLGAEIVRQANENGLAILATDRQISPNAAIEIIPADLLKPVHWDPILKGVNQVIHTAGLAHVFDKKMAAQAPFQQINEVGTFNVAQASARAGVRHFVLVSSVSVYGGIVQNADEQTARHPDTPYAKSKLAAEQCAIEVAHQSGMNLTILRMATIYGEGDPGNTARLIRSIDRGLFFWVGDGSNKKSLIHRQDAARACLTALQSPKNKINLYNVSASPVPMREIVAQISLALGKKTPSWEIPASWARSMSRWAGVIPFGPLRNIESLTEKWLADNVYIAEQIKQDLGFIPQVTIQEGLQREVAWYKPLSRS